MSVAQIETAKKALKLIIDPPPPIERSVRGMSRYQGKLDRNTDRRLAINYVIEFHAVHRPLADKCKK